MINIGDRLASDFSDPLGVLSDCHRRVERFLHTLVLVTEQAAGGGLTTKQRDALEAGLRYFADAAPLHTADEEDSLFPRLRLTDDARLAPALHTLEALHHDHEVARAGHADVDRLGHRWLADGRLSPEDVQRLAARLHELDGIYQRHIMVEDRELFPLARRVLAPALVHAIGAEMARRRGLTPPA